MKKNIFILIAFLFSLFTPIVLGQLGIAGIIYGNELENYQYETYKVELGFNSIDKEGDYYIFSVYAINPYDDIAGFQFNINPTGLFIIDSVYGGRAEENGFVFHYNKNNKNTKGTILGFSMQGNTVEKTTIVSHTNKKKNNILFYIKTKLNGTVKDPVNLILDNIVIASNKGQTLSNKFIPYFFSF